MKGKYLFKVGRKIFAHVDQVGANSYKYYAGKPSDAVQLCLCYGNHDFVMKFACNVIDAYCANFGLDYKITYVEDAA